MSVACVMCQIFFFVAGGSIDLDDLPVAAFGKKFSELLEIFLIFFIKGRGERAVDIDNGDSLVYERQSCKLQDR